MPNSYYVPGSEPPSLIDRILKHTFIITLGLFGFAAALQMLTSLVTGAEVSRSLSELQTEATLLIGGLIVIGAPISMYGALNPGWRMSQLKSWSVERIGNTSLGSGWMAYSFSVVASGNNFGTIAAQIGTGIAVGYLLRAHALWLSERRTIARLEADERLRG